MTDADTQAFGVELTKHAAIWRPRMNAPEFAALKETYFPILRPYALADVIRGAELWRAKGDKFPTPAQWITSIPKQQAGDVPMMTEAERRESDDAEDRVYEGDCCHCAECQAVNATHRPMRYVPRETSGGELVKRRHPRSGNVKILGEWIHAQRLVKWYNAREAFYQAFRNLSPNPMPRDRGLIVRKDYGRTPEREPEKVKT